MRPKAINSQKNGASVRMRDINIGQFKIGTDHPPFIIAEMSGNHNGSLDNALEIVRAAAAAGAHALKLQTYTAETMTIDRKDGDFYISDPNSLWFGRSLFDLYEQAHTPWEWHKPIFDLANELGMTAFSSPFDASAVDFLETLNVPCYKIASFEIVDLPLIRKVASTKKPMIISTGMATISEINDAVEAARQAGNKDLILLQCTSTYPANEKDSNLRVIPVLSDIFKCHTGLSDHTMGIGVAIASVALGARVIEKHFIVDRSEGGVDSAFSLEPAELTALVHESSRACKALGNIVFQRTEAEEKSTQFRRSLYVVEDAKEGELVTAENVRAIRPGGGLSPKYQDMIMGNKFSCDVKAGTPVSWNLF